MNYKTLLSLTGLPEKLALIYSTLIEHGPGTISAIEKNSSLHRPDIYKQLPKLIERGLITKREVGKRTQYVPSPPDTLLAEIESLKSSIDESMTDLKAAYEKKGSRPKVQYFEGREALKRTVSDVTKTLKKGEIYYRYGSRNSKTDLSRYRSPKFAIERDKKQLQRFVITSDERAKAYDNDMGRMVKTVPNEVLFNDDIQMMIYKDKISIVDYKSEASIIIQHTKLANFQRKIFKLLFDRL